MIWHAATAIGLVLGVAGLGEWARHDYDVALTLAGGFLATVLLAGLWLIAGAADREIKRRREKDETHG